MLNSIRLIITTTILSAFVFADVFMTELTDPQNSSDAGRYVELYNNGSEDVDLSTWSVQRWTNGNADPTASSIIELTGYIIEAGSFFIICNDDGKFTATYGMDCHLNIGTGGFADSNGDDNMALLNNGEIVDMFGVPGEDGSGTGHEFEDGRAERAIDNQSASSVWDEAGWNVDNDSGGGDGNQYAPEGFDPMAWIGASNDDGGDDDDVVYSSDFSGSTVFTDWEGGPELCGAGAGYFAYQSLVFDGCGESSSLTGSNGDVLTMGGFTLTDFQCSEGDYADYRLYTGGQAFLYDGDVLVATFENVTMEGVVDYISQTMAGSGTATVVEAGTDPSYFAENGSLVSYTYSAADQVVQDDCGTYTTSITVSPFDGCSDDAACNYGEAGECTFASENYDCDDNCIADVDCAGVCGGDAVVDDCGECGGDGSACAEPAVDLFFSEHAEGSSSNKYFEVFNPSNADVSLSNYAFVNCSNGCDDWEYTNSFAEGAVVAAGSTYTVCHGSFAGDLSLCDETRTLYHNGDDAQGLMHTASNTLLDVLGEIGDDPGSGWAVAGVANATKDHTLVRKADVTVGNAGYWEASAGSDSEDSEWIVLDQNTWDYMGSHPHNFDTAGCTDMEACNYDADATSDNGTCLYNDCNGECGGSAVADDCGVCEGDGTGCLVNVWATVDMSLSTVGDGGMKARISTINGEYNPSEWFEMEDNMGDGTWSIGFGMSAGNTYGYNFNNNVGSGYESGSGLGDCAGGNYGNDRIIEIPADAVANSEIVVPVVCWESCEACPTDIPGCMDETADNYDSSATVDDGSCLWGWPEPENLFFSEYAEGSSNHKYLEIYNGTDGDVDLSSYSLSSCSNGCDEPSDENGTNWDYPDNVQFESGTMVASGDVYVVCHGSADDAIQAECDQTFTYLSNGDDVFALTQMGSGLVLDIIGVVGDDPGSGWDAAGVSNATKDHTLVRKAEVMSGNPLWLNNVDDATGEILMAGSAGTNADDSEWVVLDQNTWDYVGFHPHDFGSADVEGCMDANATNYDAGATVQSYNEYGTSTCTYDSCADIPTAMGCLWDDGTSAEWWEGWWNCTDGGGQVCGLAEVVFELNLPDNDTFATATPHVNGSYNGWCGSCYNAMNDDDGDGTWTHVQYFSSGETHDYKFTIDGWNDQEDLTGLDCAVETDGYWNRQFTAGDANTSQTQAFCWNSCVAECEAAPSCGDGVCDENEDCSSCSVDCGECAEYTVTFDLSGLDDCGFVSVTGSFDSWSGWGANTDTGMAVTLQDGFYEYTILCVDTSIPDWWNDIWGSSTQYSAPWGSECDAVLGDNYPNYGFTVLGADMVVTQCAGTCDAVCEETPACGDVAGDLNTDGVANVTDIVLMVGYILNGAEYNVCADLSADGLVNVTDIVALVNLIIGSSARVDNATESSFVITGNELSVRANGMVQGVQLTLSHTGYISIDLEDNAIVAESSTNGTSTTIIVVTEPGRALESIATIEGDYVIEESLVVDSNANEVPSTGVTYEEGPTDVATFDLKAAYPNPFNPTTNLELVVLEASYVSVKIYNLVGQEVASLVDGMMDAQPNGVTFQWDAASMPSGVYIVRAENAGQVMTQKLMLLK